MSLWLRSCLEYSCKNSNAMFKTLIIIDSFDGISDGDASRESVVQTFVHVCVVRITSAVRIEPGGRECIAGGEVWCVAVVVRASVVEVIIGDEVVTSTARVVVGSTLLTARQI